MVSLRYRLPEVRTANRNRGNRNHIRLVVPPLARYPLEDILRRAYIRTCVPPFGNLEHGGGVRSMSLSMQTYHFSPDKTPQILCRFSTWCAEKETTSATQLHSRYTIT